MKTPALDQFLELVRRRRSCRTFAATPVPRPLLEQLLEAARWAPSNHNRQGWAFVVIESVSEIRRLAEVVRQGLKSRISSLSGPAASQLPQIEPYASFFEGAPTLILVCWRPASVVARALTAGLETPELTAGEPVSAAMATQNLLLAAEAAGLGACLLTAPLLIGTPAIQAFPTPEGHRLLGVVAVGYPADPAASPPVPPRKDLAQIVWFHQEKT